MAVGTEAVMVAVAVIMAAAILAVMVSGTRMVAAGIMAGCGSQPEFDMVVRTSVRSAMRASVLRISATPSTRTPARSAMAG
jgi:hypothetical protein